MTDTDPCTPFAERGDVVNWLSNIPNNRMITSLDNNRRYCKIYGSWFIVDRSGCVNGSEVGHTNEWMYVWRGPFELVEPVKLAKPIVDDGFEPTEHYRTVNATNVVNTGQTSGTLDHCRRTIAEYPGKAQNLIIEQKFIKTEWRKVDG